MDDKQNELPRATDANLSHRSLTTGHRRLFWLLGSILGLFLLTASVIVVSMWLESKYPAGDDDALTQSFTDQVRRGMTKPVTAALGRQVDKLIRLRLQYLHSSTGLTFAEVLARFLDERTELVERGRCAYRLARVGSPEAIAALLKVFRTAPPEQQMFLAQLISSTGSSAVKDWFLPLLNDSDEEVVRGAIRGLSAIGTDAVTPQLAGILTDPNRSESVRIEAAAGLGEIGTPAARDVLAQEFTRVSEDEVATQILNSLGRFPFAQVAGLFGEYLAATDTPAEMRVTAVEALAYSTKEAVPFLLGIADRDADADVRASSAWAVSLHSQVQNLAPTLTVMSQHETEPDVRRRIYEALLPQANIPAAQLLPTVLAEDDVAARVAGFNAIGRAIAQTPATAETGTFDQQIVPELVAIATSPNSLNIQLRAVFALRQAPTVAAQDALAVIANTARTEVANAARSGLRVKAS